MTQKKEMTKGDSKKFQNGVKMYGTWFLFETLKEAIFWCIDGMANCEGCERDRFVDAMLAFKDGWNFVNTDRY